MSVGKLSSYFTKRRLATSVKETEEGSDKPKTRQQNYSVRGRLEKTLQLKQKAGFAFNFELGGDEDGLKEGDESKGSGSNEGDLFRFEFTPTEIPASVRTSVGGKQHQGIGDANARGGDGFFAHVTGTGTAAARSAKKGGKRKGGGKKKKSGKGKGKGAGNSGRHPAENERNRERDEATASPAKGAAMVTPPAAVTTNERYQPDEDLSLGVGNDSSEGAEPLQQQPGTDALCLTRPNARRPESSPVPVVTRPPPGLTLESWKDPALTGEERRRRRFGRGVRNMVAIQRSRDARRGAEVGAADLAAEEVVADSSGHQGRLARPDPGRARGESSRASGSSVFAFGFDIGISFNEGS